MLDTTPAAGCIGVLVALAVVALLAWARNDPASTAGSRIREAYAVRRT